MNFNNFTIKAQEAVQEAVNLVQSRGQQAIEPVHVLQSVMKVGEKCHQLHLPEAGHERSADSTCTGQAN